MATKRLHKTPPQITRLYNRGVKSVIPLLHGKSPGYEGWQKISDEEAQKKIWNWSDEADAEHQPNFGIRLGPQWGDLCDIDLDSTEARQLAEYYLPETARFGRGGTCTHYLYKQLGGKSEKSPSKRYQWDKRSEKSVLLELRASGQTMGPGSVHPETGEHIEWMNQEEIREVEASDLIRAVNNLAAAALLLRDWQSGGRDELAVCLVGSMVRADWEDHDIDAFLEPILISSGDEESVKRLKAERLRSELENGGRVPGLRRLRELCSGGGLGQQGFERIVEWLDLGGGDILEELNNTYAVVTLQGGGVSIMKESDSGAVEFLDKGAFNLLYSNRMVGFRGREITADRFWLMHRDRREYLGGVVFKPGQEVRGDQYNLWRGFCVEPTEGTWGAGWDGYRQHLLTDVCGGDERIFWWLIGWMAHRVQRPWEVPQSAIVLIGERGDGKSSVFKILGRLFGRHYMTITNPRQLLGNFNAHLIDKVLVLADEAVWGGDKTNEGILKVMISEDKRVIEIKGKDAFEVDNCTAYGICSNNDWVVPVGRQERRFLILRTLGLHQGDFEYWDAMYDLMSLEGGGLSRMLYDLQRVSLDDMGVVSGGVLTGKWRGNRPPSTEELKIQQSRGMEHWVQFLVNKWERDRFDGGGCWVDDLYLEYTRWMNNMNWRFETEKVFLSCVERMLGKVTTKVRRRKTLRDGSHVMRNRLEFASGDVVKAAIDSFVG